jgi:uncharacterized protein YjbI with pentapeptide repeats
MRTRIPLTDTAASSSCECSAQSAERDMPVESFPCPKCQNKMFLGARFCMRCGTRLNEKGDEEIRPDTPKPPAPRVITVAPAPDPWASVPADGGLEAIELSDFGEPRAPAPPPVPVVEPPAPTVVAAPPVLPAPPVMAVPPLKAAPPAPLSVSRPPIPETRTDSSRRSDSMAEPTREEVLRRVRAKQSLKRAGLSGMDLSGTNLEGIDFGRADFDGAILDDAKMAGAVLTNASLRGASLKRVNLEGAKLARADFDGADLSDARLTRADFEHASLVGAKLERANLVEANLTGADLSQSTLSAADLSRSDARHASFDNSVFNGVRLDGARLAGATFAGARVTTPVFESIDISMSGDGSVRLDGDRAFAFLGGRHTSIAPKVRYFGKGDVLRDATLEFGEGSVIHIDSRFENCLITLGEGAELTIGESGVLHACEIVGGGRITVHGRFFERASPGIAGARSLTVSQTGAIVGGLEQAADATLFAFEPGCRLRVKILKPRVREAAE